MRFKAFISCRLPVTEEVRAITEMLRDEVQPLISDAPKIGNLAYNLKQQIQEADCLIVVATEGEYSPFVQNELGMACALGKPITAICKDTVKVTGIQEYLTSWITFHDIIDCAKQIPDLKRTLLTELSSRFLVAGGPDGLLDNLNQLGILGVYPDRASAFRQFLRFWNDENEVVIVGSTLEGFRKCLGVDPRKLLGHKLKNSPKSYIKILLTHSQFVSHRERQEDAREGSIKSELAESHRQLSSIRQNCNAGERLTWRYFKGSPTCFMVSAGDFMLLNPYLYMQPGIFNFSLIVRNTGSDFDIFNHYKEFHFESAWSHQELSTSDVDNLLLDNLSLSNSSDPTQ
jgi:hypothetical protein